MAEAVLPARHADHISEEQLIEAMNAALTYPAVSNAWTMPIKGRDPPVRLKISGADFAENEKIGVAVEAALSAVRGTRNAFAERTGSGHFLDIEWNRDALARYGLSVEAAQSVVQNAIAGENVTTTVEGARAVSGERPLHARFPLRHRRARACLCQRQMDSGRSRSAIWRALRSRQARDATQ